MNGRIWGIHGDECFFPDPRPKFPRGSFSLHPRLHGGKIYVLGTPNEAISVGISTDRCKLTHPYSIADFLAKWESNNDVKIKNYRF
jgi:hypothetical protein